MLCFGENSHRLGMTSLKPRVISLTSENTWPETNLPVIKINPIICNNLRGRRIGPSGNTDQASYLKPNWEKRNDFSSFRWLAHPNFWVLSAGVYIISLIAQDLSLKNFYVFLCCTRSLLTFSSFLLHLSDPLIDLIHLFRTRLQNRMTLFEILGRNFRKFQRNCSLDIINIDFWFFVFVRIEDLLDKVVS